LEVQIYRGALPLKLSKQWASFEMLLTCRSIRADAASDMSDEASIAACAPNNR
jgi:hypothetical protein